MQVAACIFALNAAIYVPISGQRFMQRHDSGKARVALQHRIEYAVLSVRLAPSIFKPYLPEPFRVWATQREAPDIKGVRLGKAASLTDVNLEESH
ncbi:hypothetical protein BURKHO8Y_110131 [Burkholderia sp. 8Y]|nr:hypothetical protein BURKHO8Y_110131 [Burkholderia sp. 8Y]